MKISALVAALCTGCQANLTANSRSDSSTSTDAVEHDAANESDGAMLPCTAAPAGVFYVDATLGSDANDGTNTCTPWKTLTKVNGLTLAAGDSVLFTRGEVFYGTLTVGQSGAVGNPITFGAYGFTNLAKPIITGLTDVSDWTGGENNIWTSSATIGASPLNMVVIDGVNTPKGRFPNTGWMTFTSHVDTTSITGSLTGTPNWMGAELVLRKHFLHDGYRRYHVTKWRHHHLRERRQR